MTLINLLPWRDLQRKEREREFYSIAGSAAVFMCLVVVYIHFHMAGLIDNQNARNDYLKQEIKKEESQIKDIDRLEKEKSQLLARMKVIEELQGQRPLMVHLFDELVKALPDGVYLTSIKQSGKSVALEGVAQSNARVSAFMRNIDASKWLTEPKLNVIEALNSKDGQKGSKFVLNIKQKTEGESLTTDTGTKSSSNKPATKTTPRAAARGKTGAKASK